MLKINRTPARLWSWGYAILFLGLMLVGKNGLRAEPGNAKVDSLEALLEASTDDFEQWDLCTQLFLEFVYSQPEESFGYADRGLDIAQSMGDDSLIAQSYVNLGTARIIGNEYSEAILYLTEGVKVAQSIGDSSLMIRIHVNLGAAYTQLGNDERGIRELEIALGLISDETPGGFQVAVFNNLGAAYTEKEQYETALDLFQRAKPLIRPWDLRRKAMNASNIAQIYNYLGQPKEALAPARESIEYARESGTSEQMVAGFNSLADALEDLGRYREAGEAVDSMMVYAELTAIPNIIETALGGKARYLESTQQYKLALEAHKKLMEYKDSVNVANQEESIAELQVKMELSEKDAAAELARSQTELERQKRLRQNNLLLLLGIGLGVLAVGAAVLVIGLAVRNRANRKLREQNKVIADKNDLLQRQKEALEDLNREKDGLIGIVAHDLKSPLNKSLALIQMIETSGELNPSQQQAVDMIRKSNTDGTQLIRDLLELNSLEQVESKQEKAPVDAREVIENLAATFAPEAQRKQIQFHLQLPPESLTLHTHRLSLCRILENLISNALKFSNSGTSIQVEAIPSPNQLELRVHDQGPGISPQDQQKLFKKFQRLSAKPTGGENSTGLGLAITKSLVERLGGEIQVKSQLGKGTSFVVSLPKAN